MKQVFRAHRLCKQEGPLGPYIDSYAAEMSSQGYAQHTSELQIRLVADFSCWLAKRRIQARKVTLSCFGRTFACEHGDGGPQEMIYPHYTGCWIC
jgi:hypothetical protein